MVTCIECNGACCRWLDIGPLEMGRENLIYWKARGAVPMDGHLWLPHICPKLSTGGPGPKEVSGLCLEYKGRPLACRVFKVGGPACLSCRKLEGFNKE
jgi:hypothetical protein